MLLEPPKIKDFDEPGQPQWVLDMRRMIGQLAAKTLCELNANERFVIAQYHAWRWANCTRDESTNRRHAGSIAAGITNLACHRDFAKITLKEYVANGDNLWTARGMRPWFKPWDITGQFDPPEKLREKVLK